MLKLALVFANNQTFVLSFDCTQLVAVYPLLATATFRLQIKTYPTDSTALLEFNSTGGTIVYNSATDICQVIDAESAITSVYGLKYFDLRVEMSSVGEFAACYGEIDFVAGVTVSNSSSANSAASGTMGDTVFVTGATVLAQPSILPATAGAVLALATSAANAVSAATVAETAAALSATAAAGSATAAATSAAGVSSAVSTGISSINSTASTAAASIASSASTAETAIASAQTTAVAAVVAAAATYIGFTEADFLAWLNSLPTSLPATSGVWWVNTGANGALQLS